MTARKNKLPKFIHRKSGRYLYFVKGGISIRMPDDPSSHEFAEKLKIINSRIDDPTLGSIDRPTPAEIGGFLSDRDLRDHFQRLQTGARGRARRDGREFTLPKGWAERQYIEQNARCAFSGLIMRKPERRHDQFGPSIDRMDSSVGYTPENCNLTILYVNLSKRDMPANTFVGICRAIADNYIEQLVNKT